MRLPNQRHLHPIIPSHRPATPHHNARPRPPPPHPHPQQPCHALHRFPRTHRIRQRRHRLLHSCLLSLRHPCLLLENTAPWVQIAQHFDGNGCFCNAPEKVCVDQKVGCLNFLRYPLPVASRPLITVYKPAATPCARSRIIGFLMQPLPIFGARCGRSAWAWPSTCATSIGILSSLEQSAVLLFCPCLALV